MYAVRNILFVTAFIAALTGLVAADTGNRDQKILVDDTAVRQAQLKRLFEQFRGKLSVLAGRLESSDQPRHQENAKRLRMALKEVSARGVEGKFDSLIRALSTKGADRSLDILSGVIRENTELKQDLQRLIALLTSDDRQLKQKIADATKLLDALKDLRNKQARMQARTELSKDATKDLKPQQEKITAVTKDLLDKLGKSIGKSEEGKVMEAVRKPVEQANGEQRDSQGKLGKGDREGAGRSQGRAVGKLNEAIRALEDLIAQARQEEQERKLQDLLARAKRMLKAEQEILTGSTAMHKELQKGKATIEQAAKVNRLAELQLANLREGEAALKVIKADGTAVAFEEAFAQIVSDMDSIHTRLNRVELDNITLATEMDVIETLKDIIKALEKAIQNNQNPQPQPPIYGTPAPQSLVNLLQQLKMVHALQKRVNDRTALYGKQYPGEQLPQPKNEHQRQGYPQIKKELKDLASRQDRLAKVTKELGKDNPNVGAVRID